MSLNRLKVKNKQTSTWPCRLLKSKTMKAKVRANLSLRVAMPLKPMIDLGVVNFRLVILTSL